MLITHEPTIMTSFFGPRLSRDQSFDTDENAVKIRLKVPGYKPEEVDASVVDNVLTISLDGDPVRRYDLSDKINQNDITAQLSLGILTVSLPLKEKASRKIPILNGDAVLPTGLEPVRP